MRLALFQPDIPQNLGGAVRLGACLAVPLDVVEPCGFPMSDSRLRRAALDYAEAAETVLHPSWAAFLQAEGRREGRLVLFTTAGATPLQDFVFEPGDTLLFGRESAGAPPEVHAAADARVVIPLAGQTRSLNLVTAAAIGLYEALRQTGQAPSPPGLGKC
jgi:tRNA (cytidine/uridine-2'-O-)-methyltransferase